MRTAAINAVFNNFPALKQALQIIGESFDDDYGRRASGLLALMAHSSVLLDVSNDFVGHQVKTCKVKLCLQRKMLRPSCKTTVPQ